MFGERYRVIGVKGMSRNSTENLCVSSMLERKEEDHLESTYKQGA